VIEYPPAESGGFLKNKKHKIAIEKEDIKKKC
jgi:hypothetical protein